MTGLLGMFWYAVTSSLEQLGQGELLIQSVGEATQVPLVFINEIHFSMRPTTICVIISVLSGAVRTVTSRVCGNEDAIH